MAALVDEEDASDSQSEIVMSLKEQLDSVEPPLSYKFTDTAILRFLRGRSGDSEKAFRALLRHVRWREENEIENIMANPEAIKPELDSGRLLTSGFDKCGRPIITIIVRRHNKDDATRDMDRIRRYLIFSIETIYRATTPEEEKMTIIFDLTGFGLYCMDYDAIKLMISTLQYNYPETLGVAYIVSAPLLFSACWMIIKPWLDEEAAERTQFVNITQLCELVDHSMIPAEILDSTIS